MLHKYQQNIFVDLTKLFSQCVYRGFTMFYTSAKYHNWHRSRKFFNLFPKSDIHFQYSLHFTRNARWYSLRRSSAMNCNCARSLAWHCNSVNQKLDSQYIVCRLMNSLWLTYHSLLSLFTTLKNDGTSLVVNLLHE